MSFIGFPISAMIYIAMFIIIYFSKKRINIFENKLLIGIMILNFVGLLLELGCYWSVIDINKFSMLKMIILKTYIVYIFTFNLALNIYIFILTNKNYNSVNFDAKKQFKKYFIFSIVPYIIFIYLVYILPIYIYNFDGYYYTYGPSINILFVISGIQILIWFIKSIISIIRNKKKNKQQIAILVVTLLLGTIGSFTQFVDKRVLILTSLHSIMLVILYFFIENPDVKMIEQLNIAKETAEKANRAKSDFLSSMSHEIRTPLNAIVGFSDCIINANSLEEAKDNAKDVVTASNTLLEIVNGILDISKIEAGKLELVETDYDIKKLLNDVIKLIRVRIGDKPLDFKVNIAEDLPQVLYGDHTNVKKIMINLLTNAVKYTDQGWISLDVKCVKVNDQICRLIVSVKDSGRGIKKEDIAKLFTKFQRVDEDRNTTIEGTGLGLAITKQLVKMMNGNIVVNSVYGEGSEFTVAIDQRLSLAKIETEKEEVTDYNLDLTGKKILIVDDNKLNIKVAEKILSKYNPTIDSCESGFECLEKVKLNNYDLILLDDMMPKMRGSEVLVKLKENPNFSTPVIMLTANAINGMEEQYLNKGFNGYLSKPIEKDKLFSILKKYLTTTKNDISNNTEAVLKEATAGNMNDNKKDINYLKENGINIDASLELLGDVATYNEILKEYVNGINEKITNLTNFKNNNDMENYAILVHSLKSESRYLGFDKLADICLQHELKSKENDSTYVNNNFNILLTELNNILKIVKQYLN